MLNDDLFPVIFTRGDYHNGIYQCKGGCSQFATIRRLYEQGSGSDLYYVESFKEHCPGSHILADELGFVLICMPENRMDLCYSEVITEVMHAIISEQKRDTYLVGRC